MIFRLIYLNGAHKGERITLSRGPMTFGRDKGCNVVLENDPEAATHHCTVEHGENDELTIRDDGSMNSILINNHEATESKLKHGDTIEIGRTRFLVQAFVQADVAHKAAPSIRKKKSPVPTIIITVLLAVLAIAGYKKIRAASKAAELERVRKEMIPAAMFKDREAVDTATPAAPQQTQQVATNEPPATPVVEVPKPVEPKQEPAPVPEPKPVIPAPIEIVSLNQQKFPQKPDYDEMRVVTLTLRTTGGVVEDAKVAIRFDFFDRDLTTGEITRARAIVPTKALQTESLAETGEETVTATYTVPKGLRTARAANSGRAFYGVRVKVMYAGELVAQKAIPTTLLDKD